MRQTVKRPNGIHSKTRDQSNKTVVEFPDPGNTSGPSGVDIPTGGIVGTHATLSGAWLQRFEAQFSILYVFLSHFT